MEVKVKMLADLTPGTDLFVALGKLPSLYVLHMMESSDLFSLLQLLILSQGSCPHDLSITKYYFKN